MRIIFQYLIGGGGALSNIILLLQALAKQYPNDHIDVICSPSSDLLVLNVLPNVDVIPYGGKSHQELDRLVLGFGALGKIAKKRNADVVWSMNFGSYIQSTVPQVLSIHNAHQVYPWEYTRYHPANKVHVAVLRWFFRLSLRVSSGAITQTSLMAGYVGKISGAPKQIHVVPKSVESDIDVNAEPLPHNLLELFNANSDLQTFTFLYVSTCYPHKNHKVLIDAFEKIAEEQIPVRLLLTIHEHELLAIGGARAKQLIGSGHLVPIGWAKKVFLKSLYDACDACLMPSVLESLSSAHLEAMQWGKPQISSDLPYARSLCGEAALYASAEDSDDWVVKIKEFISDETLRLNLVKAGRERMKDFPATWAEAAQNVHTFLEEIVVNAKLKQ